MEVNQAVGALREALGAQVVALPDEFGDRRVEDWSGLPSAVPLALIRPRDTSEVAVALEICARYIQPVVTQGGLTGLVGGANVTGGEVALSLDRMNQIVEIDAVSGTMTVQAGTPLQVVQEAASAAGFYFPLDLGARGSCSIGGNLATNAGGNRVIKYGMMRDQVLGIEAVLASGAIVGGLNKMIKDNSGYDLRNLLIGSEGTLAVITRAVLRRCDALRQGWLRVCRRSRSCGRVTTIRCLPTWTICALRLIRRIRSMCCWKAWGRIPSGTATRSKSS
jgi:FAD/FMN-containing dehydrogenase